ncbi:tetratricopeptide repeat protein [Gracilimonas mengyeensis]|uniref:Tetratricopeptide repeat-containing protein n=1 Tax=Gracilimonas mengyeensis TaxID=1302730 RepID=A0A521EQ67_9BACT|nr:tetratricopeptide repeat protein [Gracilimonas mengyeensis]SMO86074.1 Tetratricopeptide repeat-containing protein [Gracilimonas mengyeensis]
MKAFKISTIAAVLVMMATTVFAQTQTEAINAFNKGLEEAQANNYDEAIRLLEDALEMANKLGPDGADVKERVEGQIPTIYFRKAANEYKSFQQSKSLEDLETTIAAFQEAGEVANEFNSDQIAGRARGIVPQLYYQESVLYYSREEFTQADEAVQEALNLNSNYALAYYQKAKIFKKINDTDGDGIIDQGYDEMLRWYDQAITKGQATNNEEVVQKSRDAAHDELLAAGSRASGNDELDLAFDLLTRAIEYNAESSDAFYRLAEAHNKAGNPEQAVENANRALEFESGGRTDRAKIYYELGYAHQSLGNKAEACDALTNALYGSFKSPAEHIMEYELKCDSTAP